MERDREIAKLVNVLYRISRSASYAVLRGNDREAARFCAGQYNRVLAKLTELEPAVGRAFQPLAEDASPEVIRIAARELAAYFEDEAQPSRSYRAEHGCGGARVRVHWSPARGRCG